MFLVECLWGVCGSEDLVERFVEREQFEGELLRMLLRLGGFEVVLQMLMKYILESWEEYILESFLERQVKSDVHEAWAMVYQLL